MVVAPDRLVVEFLDGNEGGPVALARAVLSSLVLLDALKRAAKGGTGRASVLGLG